MDERAKEPLFWIVATVVLTIVVGAGFAVWPQYKVYSETLAGEARLKEAESSRRIQVLEAQAALDSAQLTADAEVLRATGVAEANAIIAEGLGGPEGYLRWRYIEMLESNNDGNSIIYIPTEAGLPILEAGRLK